jgi:hypothetical protein
MKTLTFFLPASVLPLYSVDGFLVAISGIKIKPVQGDANKVALDDYLKTPSSERSRTLFIFRTYTADFNAIEYARRL